MKMDITEEKSFWEEYEKFMSKEVAKKLKFYVNYEKKTIVAAYDDLTAKVKLAEGDVWSEYAGKMAAAMKLFDPALFKAFMKAKTFYHGKREFEEDKKQPSETLVRKEPTGGDIIGDLSMPKEEKPFLMKFLKERGFNVVEAAQLCDVGKSTIARAMHGYRLRKESFQQIVKGLEMTPEEAKEFKKSLRRKQDDYHGREKR